MARSTIFYLLLFLMVTPSLTAQETPVKDSAQMYRNIEKYSQKRKFTKFLHGLIFEPMTPKTIKARKKVQRQRFKKVQGKIIRRINIVTYDPFGYSESDTTAQPRQALAKLGNRLHLKTKRLTIWNLLLIRKNRPLDSLLVKESERLIRTQRYIRRVVITPIILKNSDSVDVDVRVLDSWSLLPNFSASTSRATYEVTERNFLGLGHQFENTYRRDMSNNDNAYSMKYTIPNIMNTYIRTTLNYNVDLNDNYAKSINIERPFFSPYARWAAGVIVGQQFRTDTIRDVSDNYEWQNFKFSTKDFWGAHSYQLFKGNTEDDRTTNLITSARFLNINYQESPSVVYDSINYFATETNWLFGLGIASRQFIEDKYLFNYGIIEDVPVGKAVGLTGGFQEKNGIKRLYAGARITLGKYYKWGYLSSNFEYGSYYNKGSSEQSAFTFESNYFTNLRETGKWKFRQFIKAAAIIGNDRQASYADYLNLNERNGLRGFRTESYGSKKLLMTLQTQSYAPWTAWGFRLNPFFSYTMGMLGDGPSGFSNSKPYSQISLGFLISNDYLVFSTFQLSLSYYPTIPNQGDHIFRNNAFNTDDFSLQDFDLAKPRTVNYR